MSASTVRRTLILTALLVWPLIPHVPYDALSTAVLACEYLVAALSLVLLIGLVGQISLCQAALVGMGAFVSAIATKKAGIDFPFSLIVGTVAGAVTAAGIGVVALRVRGLYLAVATLIFAYLCDRYLFAQPWLVDSQSGTSIPFQAIGRPGTIPFFDLADAHAFYYVAIVVAALALYIVANLRDSRIGRAFAAIRGSEVAAASLGIAVTRVKLVGFASAGALAGLGGALTLVGSRTVGPGQFSFTNSLYFLAIAVVGGLRSLGGAVASAVLFALLVGEVFFRSPRLADYLDVISSGVLILVLLFFRGGLGAIPQRLQSLGARLAPVWNQLAAKLGPLGSTAEPEPSPGRRLVVIDRLRSAGGRVGSIPRRLSMKGLLFSRAPKEATEPLAAAPPMSAQPIDVLSIADRLRDVDGAKTVDLHVEHFDSPSDDEVSRDSGGEAAGRSRLSILMERAEGESLVAGHPGPDGRRLPVLLSAEHITVRFGGLAAVSDASLQVGAGEIVGLIGPNGAGKTTLFNSILGLNSPTEGHVHLFGHDVTAWDVHRRAALGVGRTFQILQLFGDLTVFDNLLVATHLQNRTGFWGSLVVSPRAQHAERAARERVEAVLELMELGEVADRQVAGLPFGVLRLVEVARTLVTGARLVCFDEPASGLDSSETERLIQWFQFLREIGITLLVIEHDVDMVVRLCDHIYVLDQGRLLASGSPQQIQRDPAVIASYLGAAVEVA
ncbi:MAG TPA: branched-chain amino acid ABC transporter ATP-binding protein/permease [Candidatus Angelobacter sp.]|nr:branched-chain amino acid ABC transporter ATP-binding protein/permease [Candidatus Angelobacter sp.]